MKLRLFGSITAFLTAGCLLISAPAQAQFTQQGSKLVGTGVSGQFAEQGHSVSLSADGNTAIVGGPDDGAAWVFTRSGGVWSQQGSKLTGTGGSTFPSSEFGASVSLSGDGNTALIGGANTWVLTRSGGVWTQEAELSVAGAVSLSRDGNTALIGTAIFTQSSGIWTQQATLNTAQAASVSLSADGSTAIVGAPSDSGGIGAAWVFTRSGTLWSQQGFKLIGTGAAPGSAQGSSVSLSADGNTAAVGAPGANGIWIFTRSGNLWTQQGSELTGATTYFAYQGTSVFLSGDGNTVIEGGPLDSTNGIPSSGAFWVFTRSPSGVWSQLGPKLVGTGAFDGYYTEGSTDQGASVALSSDGTTAIVGGPVDHNYIGAAWVFVQPPKFAGTPGKANCYGQSVSALARQYVGLNAAATALGFSDVKALQKAIRDFCGE
jgi:lipocalin